MSVSFRQASIRRQTLPSLLIAFLILPSLLVLIGDKSASAQASDFVVFPSPEVEFIVGPQLRLGASANPFYYFDATQLKGVQHGTNFPATPPTGDSQFCT